jgi:hypothetical protein
MNAAGGWHTTRMARKKEAVVVAMCRAGVHLRLLRTVQSVRPARETEGSRNRQPADTDRWYNMTLDEDTTNPTSARNRDSARPGRSTIMKAPLFFSLVAAVASHGAMSDDFERAGGACGHTDAAQYLHTALALVLYLLAKTLILLHV